MKQMPGRLGTLRARDVMSNDVHVLQETTTLTEATEQLKTYKHSGAPVVDSRGKLVGTFSLRNLTGVKRGNSQVSRALSSSLDSAILSAEAVEKMMQTQMGQEKVADRMTENPPSVTENASLIDVARLMCDFHTHRIPVTNSRFELVGIITTMDILAALVHTADELAEG